MIDNMLIYNIIIILIFCVVLHDSTVSAAEKCYAPYGCFSNKKPFNNAQGQLPNSPQKQQIKFWLYTSSNAREQQIKPTPESATSIPNSRVIRGVPTFLIIHGFRDSGRSKWMKDLKNQLLLKLERKNVIIVHWAKGAKHLNYYKAAANTRVVGAVTGRLIVDLNRLKNIPLRNIHIIGHSLGAHTAGYAGKAVKNSSPGKKAVGRISALDPAGLAFANYNKKVKVDKTDAEFVDAIHTNSGNLLLGEFGYKFGVNVGDVDFVVNGGKKQPGCGILSIGCSHSRAYLLFANSIRKCRFPATNCRTGALIPNAEMGLFTRRSLRGRLCVKTTSKQPFCNTQIKSPNLMAEPVSRLLGMYASDMPNSMDSNGKYSSDMPNSMGLTGMKSSDMPNNMDSTGSYSKSSSSYGRRSYDSNNVDSMSRGYGTNHGRYYTHIVNKIIIYQSQLTKYDIKLLRYNRTELLKYTTEELQKYKHYSKAEIRQLSTPELRKYILLRKCNRCLRIYYAAEGGTNKTAVPETSGAKENGESNGKNVIEEAEANEKNTTGTNGTNENNESRTNENNESETVFDMLMNFFLNSNSDTDSSEER